MNRKQADIRKHGDDTGNLRIFEIGLERDLKSSRSAIHTDEQAHRSQRGAPLPRGCAGKWPVAFSGLNLGASSFSVTCVSTRTTVLRIKLESDETKNAHDERDDENTLTTQIIASIVNQHQENNLAEILLTMEPI